MKIKHINPVEFSYDFYDDKGNGYNIEDLDGKKLRDMNSIRTIRVMNMEQLKVYLKERVPTFTDDDLQQIKDNYCNTKTQLPG